MHTLANSEKPDKMMDNAVFSSWSTIFAMTKGSSEKEIQFYLEIIIRDSTIFIPSYRFVEVM